MFAIARLLAVALAKCDPRVLLRLLLFALLGGAVFDSLAQAICAEVKIEIRQKVSLERQAFDVALKVNNGLADRAIEALRVTLLVSDLAGNAVVFTTDPNSGTAAFFYRLDTLTGTAALDGSSNVEQSSQAEARWLFIPASGAAGSLPSGKQYRIGAAIEYAIAGQTQSVEVEPEIITVRAQPKLRLDYFLQPEIYADDPFTVPVEPSEPAVLGVRVKNTGLGAAVNMKIDSAQPRIVENRQGLAIGFRLEGGYVNDQSRGSSLLLDFGTIAAGASVMGRWDLTTTLAGRFVDFEANFTHADALGGALTSLIDSLTSRFLVRDVIVDLPGRDSVRDFLSSDGGWFVYESDGVDTPVVDVSVNSTLSAVPGGYRLQHQTSPLLSYSKVVDPTNGALQITSVVRSDGKILNPQNYWLSKTRDAALVWRYAINIFDSQSTGDYVINGSGAALTSIAGRVFDDTNGDGAFQASEPGIGVVKIELSGAHVGGGTSSAQTYTQPDGSYEFTGLQAGSYTLSVGPTPARVDGVPILGNAAGAVGVSPNGAPTVSSITIVEGQNATGYLFSKRRPANINTTDLGVAIQPSSVVLRPNTSGSLVVSVENLGPASAQANSVGLTLPSFLSVSAVAPVGTSFDASSAIWYVGDLAVGVRRELRLTVHALAGAAAPASAPLVATVQSASDDIDARNNADDALVRLRLLPVCSVGNTLTIEPRVLIRYLQGARGVELVADSFVDSTATLALAEALADNLTANLIAYDFDGNGEVSLDVDAVIYARYALGLRGQALVDGLSLPAATLLTAIEARLGACE